MKIIKSLFYFSNFSLILFYLYPGNIFGCFVYNDCQIQPQLTRDLSIFSSNHLYSFIIVSLLGFVSFKQKTKKIFIYLFFMSIFLEMMHIIIPDRSFELPDLLGNILGVVISFFIIKILYKKNEHI
tara:strand:+ start:393 stop:770 length:378 start_codon:yes stop_codon:yes gene_type:complete